MLSGVLNGDNIRRLESCAVIPLCTSASNCY